MCAVCQWPPNLCSLSNTRLIFLTVESLGCLIHISNPAHSTKLLFLPSKPAPSVTFMPVLSANSVLPLVQAIIPMWCTWLFAHSLHPILLGCLQIYPESYYFSSPLLVLHGPRHRHLYMIIAIASNKGFCPLIVCFQDNSQNNPFKSLWYDVPLFITLWWCSIFSQSSQHPSSGLSKFGSVCFNLQTKGSQVWFQSMAHTILAGSSPAWTMIDAHEGGNQWMCFSHINVFLCLSLSLLLS